MSEHSQFGRIIINNHVLIVNVVQGITEARTEAYEAYDEVSLEVITK